MNRAYFNSLTFIKLCLIVTQGLKYTIPSENQIYKELSTSMAHEPLNLVRLSD